MDNQPSFDRGIFIPIGVSIFSLIGICVILLLGRFNAARATVEEIPTATPFKYSLIGTEPALSTVTGDGSETDDGLEEEDLATATAGISTSQLPDTPSVLSTNTISPNVPIITLPPTIAANTPTRTPTSASGAPLGAGTYDDTHDRLVYSGSWTTQSGAAGAYQNTLHVSGTLGNSVSFRFIGKELRVFFQAGSSLGTIRLTLDGTVYDRNQSEGTQIYEWVLPEVASGTHNVTITHLSGGSVNLDSIIIPEIPVTPTNTATPTSTSS
jgi:hypothetical protein